MTFAKPDADIYVPDKRDIETAFRRVTHLGIGAHQDDLEFMAFHGIAACHELPEPAFGGVVCTDGSGSARSGAYAGQSGEAIRDVRQREQRAAADLGRYAVMVQLGYPSPELRDGGCGALEADLRKILDASRPQLVYAHNPADKHLTHIFVLAATLRAIRSLPAEARPARLLGCEVWRDLDWMLDSEKVALDVSGAIELSDRLNRLFDSQIGGGKRYDLAIPGRRLANATFFDSHSTDDASQITFAMDLTPLVSRDDAPEIEAFVLGAIDRFRNDVQEKLQAAFG